MSRCSTFQYLPSLRCAHGLPVASSGMTSITMVNPTSVKVCPASRPNTPPAKLSVMLALIASPRAQHAIMIPNQRRSPKNQRCPVSMIIGVTRRDRNRFSSAPVPSVSSTETAKVLAFTVMSAGSMKNRGTSPGRPSRISATALRLIREPPNLKSASIHSSTGLISARGGGVLAGSFPGFRLSVTVDRAG
jgi:hypothetical protein